MKKATAVLLSLLLLVCLLSLTALAGDAPDAIYVSAAGDDTKSGSTEAEAVATLAKAAELVNSGSAKDYVVYVMSDLTSTACARFYSKNVTITSLNGSWTVTRGDGFSTLSDPARSCYNPAMVEIQTSQGSASLTLTNITFDDQGKHEGTVFAQAISGEGCEDNLKYVQDAIIASNATEDCSITLGEGARLLNYGGMSAVRVTNKAVVTMKAGSLITDTTVTTREKGPDVSNGPAGAVWTQGGGLITESGSEIKDMVGRAVYADGGSISLGGSISGIKGLKDAMWQGSAGCALHLRSGAAGTLTATAVIDGCSGGGSAVVTHGCDLTMEKGAVIKNTQNTTAVAVQGAGVVLIDGEITGNNGTMQALNVQGDNFNVTLGANANIHHNHTGYGTIYSQGTGGQLHIYGKINDNIASDRGGALAMANNLGLSMVTMYEGAEICRNYSKQTGGGVMVSVGTFIMKGGLVTDNIAKQEGGGFYVRRGGTLIVEGGTISGNASALLGGGINYEAGNYKGGVPNVVLTGGTITGNRQNAAVTLSDEGAAAEGGQSNDIAIRNKGGNAATDLYGRPDRNLSITANVTLGNKAIAFQQDSKTVTPSDSSIDIKLGNASPSSVTALKTQAAAKGWAAPLATFWMQRGSRTTLTVGGLTPNAEMPVYALVVETGEDGNPVTGGRVSVYNTEVSTADGGTVITVSIPSAQANGCAVALVQPTADWGKVVITTSLPVIRQDKTAESYDVPYRATYTMSQSLLSMVKAAALSPNDFSIDLKYVVELDDRLTAKSENGKYLFTFDGGGLLEADADNIVVSADGHTITVPCRLTANWEEAVAAADKMVMTLDGIGVLAADDFTANDELATTGNIDVTVGGKPNILIPANVCHNRMVPTYTVTYTGGVGGEEVFADDVHPGLVDGDETPAFEGTPKRKGYKFTGWAPEVAEKVTGNVTYTAQWEKDGPILPETGMLWWPVPVLALLGAFCLLTGMRRSRKRFYK